MTDVTVMGLGQMGTTLADLLLKAGQSVTVWNRNPEKAAALVSAGAEGADGPAEAIAASPIVVVCVADYAAVQTVFDADGAAEAVKDRLVINLGTGGPEEVRAFGDWLGQRNARYVDGAIQAAPSQMGQPDTPILVSGDRASVAEGEAVLRIFCGQIVDLGERIDAAAYMDLATLSYVYGAFAGFLHGARMAEAVGIDVAELGSLVQTISPSFGAFFHHEGGVIQSGDFRITESPMRISFPAVERILRTSETLKINTSLPALVHHWLERAKAKGWGDEEAAALIKVLREG